MATGREQRSNASRQRLAWTVLLSSFTACVILTVAVPFSVNAYLQNATQFLNVTVQANQGTVGIDDVSDVRQAVLVGQPGQTIEPGASILTDATATALVSIFPPDSELLLSRLQVYGNTTVTLEQADSPRFTLSDGGQKLHLDLETGRIRLIVPEFEERPLLILITTPHGKVTIETAGQYSITATNAETQVAVQDGRAHVVAQGHFVDLDPGERSVIATGSIPSIPLGAERNLIQNSDFSEGWDRWRQYVWDVELANQPAGQVDVTEINGVPTLYVHREGSGHAGVEVRQTINQPVTDSETLILEVDFRIVSQSLDVCGSVGSECPLMIRIDYEDTNGNNQVWLQGFYAKGAGGLEGTPDLCETCPSPRFVHQRVVPDQIVSYRFNLKDDLQLQAFLPPRRINSISLLVSGHSFEVEVLRVDMLVEEIAREG